jgi:hypothetical protein
LLRQKKVSKEKATPGRSESPAQNRASKAAGQLARRYRLLTQTVPALKPWPPNFVRLAPQWGFGASSWNWFFMIDNKKHEADI